MHPMNGFSRARFSRASLPLVFAALAALGLWACGTDSDHDESTVKIVTPANGTTVTGPNVLLQVSTTGFTYAGSEAAKISATQHGGIAGGHIHVYLDKPAGLDADAITSLYKYDTTTLNITTAGTHYIIVEGADANHVDVESMHDSVAFTVSIP